jgi:hypothetical protein
MDRMIHKAMPIFIVEMPEWRLSDHGESAANSAQNCYREGSRQCDRLLPTRSRHCSCYEAVIQRLSKAATMRSRLERIVKLQPVGSQLLAFLSFSRSMPAAIILLIAESSRA